MSREKYRHRVEILRRPQDSEDSGGYSEDEYEKIGETSCEVRDESPAEYAAAESAGIEHVRTFTMRKRKILEDDVLVWDGIRHRVRTVDGYKNQGREIRVRASYSRSRYSVRGQNVTN
jgi:hypothetical protein